MRLAIVGAGISGLSCAYLLAPSHEVTVFEQHPRIGGHVHTHSIELEGRTYSVDSGFIVFNEWTYPNFTRLLRRLGVATAPTHMSFGVRDEQSGLEYSATGWRGLFAMRRKLLSPSHYRMVADILRFGRTAHRLIASNETDLSLSELLAQGGYSAAFRDHFIVPMAAAIWSADRHAVLQAPACFFVRFFHNHAMLNAVDKPVWRVIRGGSKVYVDALVTAFRGRIRTNAQVRRVERSAEAVTIVSDAGAERFDQVIFACHSDEALALLADASDAEREVLAALRYQANEAILHTDVAVLPRRRAAWAAWNYHVLDREGPVAVSYNMNRLQGLQAPETFVVTLNRAERINPARILRRIQYHHPVFDRAAVQAQEQHQRISGVERTHYCGAYWFNGFHEDGIRSGLRVARRFGKWLP